MHDVVGVEQVLVAVLPVLFLARYLRRVKPAKRTAESWYLIGSNAAFALVLLLGLATLIFGRDWPHRDLIRGLAYGLVLGVFVAQHLLLERALRQPSRDD